jgi:hypothetical protein
MHRRAPKTKRPPEYGMEKNPKRLAEINPNDGWREMYTQRQGSGGGGLFGSSAGTGCGKKTV